MVSVVICGVQSRFAVTTGSIPKLSERFVVGSGRGLVSPHPDRQLPLRRASQNQKNEAHPGVGMPLGLCSEGQILGSSGVSVNVEECWINRGTVGWDMGTMGLGVLKFESV